MAAPINGWVGNIGSDPEFREFPNGNDQPRRLCRLNVYFDNQVPDGKGGREDKGGFWMQVEWWHRDAERYSELLQKGMRVTVSGRQVKDTWRDRDSNEEKSALKIQATQVTVGLHRIADIVMEAKQSQAQPAQAPRQDRPAQQQGQDYDSFDDDLPM